MYFQKALLIALCLVISILMLLIGMFGGVSYQSTKHKESVRVQNMQSKRIAVVNQDLGVEYKGKHVNFSQVIIDSIIKNCVTVSKEGGEAGLVSGTYGIMIVFPSNFSDFITKINDYTPQKVKLKYSVNPNLSQQDTIEVIANLLGIESNINDTLSYMYISSVFDELHSAQNNVGTVLTNDIEDMEALNAIERMNMVAPLNLTTIEREPLQIKEIDYSKQIETNKVLTKKTLDQYAKCYELAQKDFEEIRAGYLNLQGAEDEWQKQVQNTVDSIVPGFIDKYEVPEVSYSDSDWYTYKSQLDIDIAGVYGITLDGSDEPDAPTPDELLSSILQMVPEESRTEAEELIKQYAQDKTLYQQVKTLVDTYFNSATDIAARRTADAKESLNNQLKNYIDSVQPLMSTTQKLITDYRPNKHVDESRKEIDKLNSEFTNNTTEIEEMLNKKTHEDIEYLMKIYYGCDEYVMNLKDDIISTKEESDRLLKEQVAYFSTVKTQTSNENKKMMNEFAVKLPNTKIGSQGNTNVYQFMASPMQALDINYGSLPTDYDNTDELIQQKNLLRLIILILLFISVTILFIYVFSRRISVKLVNEYENGRMD